MCHERWIDYPCLAVAIETWSCVWKLAAETGRVSGPYGKRLGRLSPEACAMHEDLGRGHISEVVSVGVAAHTRWPRSMVLNRDPIPTVLPRVTSGGGVCPEPYGTRGGVGGATKFTPRPARTYRFRGNRRRAVAARIAGVHERREVNPRGARCSSRNRTRRCINRAD